MKLFQVASDATAREQRLEVVAILFEADRVRRIELVLTNSDRMTSRILGSSTKFREGRHVTPKFTRAIALAARAHEGQVRKGTPIPYITHPVAVAGLVAQYGGDEDQQIAAVLHDVLEDGGPQFAAEIEREFGGRVLAIVQGCTDGTPDAKGKKAPWEERKQAYLEHLAIAGEDVWLVSGCDKLSNARAILDDLISIGPVVFERFTAKQVGTLWYYRELARTFTDAEAPMCEELAATVSKINELVAA